MEFKYRLRDLRREKRLSGQDLVNLLGRDKSLTITRQAISKWENGNSFPQVDTCLKLCQIFDCSMDYLLGLSDNRHDDVGLDPTEATIIERLRELPEDHRKAVELFVEFLHVKAKDPS